MNNLISRQVNNIGTLRFLGAFMVLFSHGYSLCIVYGKDPITFVVGRYTPWHQPVSTLGVIMFFVLSGYLVTQSYLNKNNIVHYAIARCARIYPALIVAVLFCIFVVGTTQTVLPLDDYLRHPVTWDYFFNNASLRSVQVNLPGVFEVAPFPGSVNGSLWTLPIELNLYVVVGVLGLVGILKRAWLFNLVVLAAMLFFVTHAESMQAAFSAVSAPYLVSSFALGALFYINRNYIVVNGKIAVALIMFCILLREVNILGVYYRYLALLPFVYLVIYLAFMPFALPRFDKYGDFSYGLYLYAYPLQQICVTQFGIRTPLLVDVLALIGAMCLAIFSWYCIEKPVLKFVPNSRVMNVSVDQK